MSNKNETLTKNIIFYTFFLLYAVVLLYLSKELNVWVDEAYTLNTTANTLSNVIKQSYNFESQPPIYFILLSLWRCVNSGILFARLFSLLSIGLASWFLYRIVLLIFGKESSKWLIVIFLLNPFTVWAGLEIRLYAFLLFLSTLTIYLFFRYYIENKKKLLYYFLIACLVGLYTQYFFVFLISALAFSALIFKGWEYFYRLCLHLAPVVILFLPSLMFFKPIQIGMLQSGLSETTLTERFFVVFQSPKNLLLALQMAPFEKGIRWAITAIYILLTGYAYYNCYKKYKNVETVFFKKINFILLSVIIVVILLGSFVAIVGIDYHDRYLTVGFSLFIILLVVYNSYSILLRNITFGIVAIYYFIILLLFYRYPVKHYDYKAIASYIEKIERKREPILFYHSTLSLPFMYYYKGHNNITPLPAKVKFDTTFLRNINDTIELKQSFEKLNKLSDSYILISDLTEPQYSEDINRKMVNNFLTAHFNITLDSLYYGLSGFHALRIRRLENKTGK